MKIRNGFVSNSSSSSFCIYAAELSPDQLDVDSHEVNKKMKELGIRYWWGNPYDYNRNVYVGRSWDSIGDDETGRQFKDSVENAIKELMNDETIKCNYHEDSWYDG